MCGGGSDYASQRQGIRVYASAETPHARPDQAHLEPRHLNCSYCFYLSKAELYPWADHPKLTLETFQTFLDQHVPMSAPMLSFMWQGGEPTMMGLPFFEDVVRLQMRAVREAVPDARPAVSNAIQTNATMLNDNWARFFKR